MAPKRVRQSEQEDNQEDSTGARKRTSVERLQARLEQERETVKRIQQAYENERREKEKEKARRQLLEQAASDKAKSELMQSRSILDNGLPPLSENRIGSKSRYSRGKHPAAKILKKTFNIITDLQERLAREADDRIWATVKEDGRLGKWSVETDIGRFVKDALTNIQEVLRYQIPDAEMELQSEGLMETGRADMWAIVQHGVPVGAVEVKLPISTARAGENAADVCDATEDESVAGQLYDYMSSMRTFHGLRNVYGIVSTYETWRIFWLPDCDQSALTQEISAKVGNTADRSAVLPKIPTWNNDIAPEKPTSALATIPNVERVLHASERMSWNDRNLIVTLASVVLKMVTSPIDTPKALVSVGRQYIQVDHLNYIWTRVVQDVRMSFWPVPSFDDTRKMFLLHYLGEGAYGSAWLAMTGKGQVCVIKFPMASRENHFENEAQHWKNIWGIPAYTRPLRTVTALILPYVRTCTPDLSITAQIRRAAEKAIESMVEKGYWHRDLHWRHVGLYKDGKRRNARVQAILIDLGLVDECKTKEEKEHAIKDMRRQLSLTSSNPLLS